MTMPLTLRTEMTQLLDDLPLEALHEVRQFVEFLKFKQQHTPPAMPVAIGGWLADYRFTADDIAQARAEMWARFQDDDT